MSSRTHKPAVKRGKLSDNSPITRKALESKDIKFKRNYLNRHLLGNKRSVSIDSDLSELTQQLSDLSVNMQRDLPLEFSIDLETLIEKEFENGVWYQGFNPSKAYEEVNNKLTGNREEKLRKISLALLFINRMGANNRVAINKIDAKLKNEYQTIFHELAIQSGVRGLRVATSDIITLPRLQATFPGLTARLLKRYGGKSVFPETKLPIYFQFSAAPSIMTETVWENYREDFLQWSYQCSLAFSNGVNQPSFDNAVRMALVCYNSDYISPDMREAICSQLAEDDVQMTQ